MQTGPRVVLLCLLAAALTLPAEAQRDSRVKTVIVGVSARRDVDPALALAMGDVVQGVFTSDATRVVLGREDIRRVISFEEERQSMGCDTASCLSELAAALDVDRMITGSLDKVGSSYFVVLSEIDARSVEPIARVQGRLPFDEDALVGGVHDLATDLLAKSGAAPVRFSDATLGSLVIKTEPPGVRVFIAGEPRGLSPVRVDGLPAGTHKVLLQAAGFAPVEVEVPVYKTEVTEIGGRLGEREPPTSRDLEDYASAVSWNNATGWTRVVSGGLCAAATPCAAGLGAMSMDVNTRGGLITGALCGSLSLSCGALLCGWGAFDLWNPPEDPMSAAEASHRLIVTPPPGQGEVRSLDLEATPGDEMAH